MHNHVIVNAVSRQYLGVQQRNTNNARHLNEEQLQPQQTPNTTTRTEENNRETTEGSTNVKI
jgi:hypothetical protein